MYQVAFPNSTMGVARSGLRVQSFSRCRSYPRLVYLSTYRMGNLFELLGDKTTKRKEKNPSLSLSYILELFLSLSLSRSGCWGSLVICASIDPPPFLSLRQQLAISELFDCLTFFFFFFSLSVVPDGIIRKKRSARSS